MISYDAQTFREGESPSNAGGPDLHVIHGRDRECRPVGQHHSDLKAA